MAFTRSAVRSRLAPPVSENLKCGCDSYRQRDTSGCVDASVPAGHGNGQAQRTSGTDLLLEFEIVESRRKRDAVPRLGGLDRARKAGEGSLLGLAFVGIAAGSDVDEPVHGGERKTNGASGQGLI